MLEQVFFGVLFAGGINGDGLNILYFSKDVVGAAVSELVSGETIDVESIVLDDLRQCAFDLQ